MLLVLLRNGYLAFVRACVRGCATRADAAYLAVCRVVWLARRPRPAPACRHARYSHPDSNFGRNRENEEACDWPSYSAPLSHYCTRVLHVGRYTVLGQLRPNVSVTHSLGYEGYRGGAPHIAVYPCRLTDLRPSSVKPTRSSTDYVIYLVTVGFTYLALTCC